MAPLPNVVIAPTRGWRSLRLKEVWAYRELLYFLTWRDIKVRYKQAVLGVAWVVIQPLLGMVVFTIVFNKLLGVTVPDTYPGVPYTIFSFTGLLPWGLFATSLQKSGTSLVGNAGLLTKIYFPRLVIPLSAILGALPDFLISLVVLGFLMAFYHISLSWNILWLPAFVLLAMATSLSVGLWLSALNVLYRDVQYVIPFLIQLWMFLSPVAWPLEKVQTFPGWVRLLFLLNPLAGVIQGFRWALLGGKAPSALLAASVVMVLLLLVSGFFYFKRMERTFADLV